MTQQKPNKKHAGGRPTKYKREYAQQLIEYFTKEVVEKIENKTRGMGKNAWEKTEVRYEAVFFPTIELFAAKEIGVNDDTIVEWATTKYPEDYSVKALRGKLRHPEFSAAYMRAKGLQKGLVIQYGMIGKLDSRFATFFANVNLGMTPNSEVEEHITITTRKHRAGDKH